jgi:glucokinase
MFFNAAREGVAFAVSIVDDAMAYLGIGVDSLIKLFNPEIIVFSGGLVRAGDIYFEKLNEHSFKNKLHHAQYDVKLVPSSFKDEATLIGAFLLVISKVFQFENGELALQ